jgi:excisionase family DNA binding protein
VITIQGEEYLTADEAAGALGVKVATLYTYVSRGLLASYREGIRRRGLYRRSEVDALGRLEPRQRRRSERRGRGHSGLPRAEEWIPLTG